MAESEEELKNLSMKVKEESEKVGLKHSKNEDHGIWSHHFMTNRWGDNGNSERLCFGAPKSLQMVTEAMKLRCFLLGRKVMTNLDSILQRRQWQPTPVFLSGESQGQGSLMGFRLWGRTELDTTEVT